MLDAGDGTLDDESQLSHRLICLFENTAFTFSSSRMKMRNTNDFSLCHSEKVQI